ncbi:MAG TPA: histidine--tRNA ligase [Bacteroidales bacterium]|nr:histidine--tRNA ligase [Bacteroidales bacterium]
MSMKPSIPQGTRDFGPVEMARRNYIYNTIRNVFELYGFQQIETPAMENLSTLLGKYGEEGDKLLFRILNSGDYLTKVDDKDFRKDNSLGLSGKICERGLRYDLTVPFARFVVQHREELTFPFRRYQIQPVWRADRPQKGRYREFYQCDADIVGSDSLLNEWELVQIVNTVFEKLGINICLKINNRKVLSGIAEAIGAESHITDITVAIDKLDKIGIEKVKDELKERGITESAVEKLIPIIEFKGSSRDKLELLRKTLAGSATGLKGIEEVETLLNYIDGAQLSCEIEFDLSLARGLNYYTGAIFEVKAKDVAIGSISGGGRYDNLTGVFGMPGVSGVGISFGADRIYDVLLQLNLFPSETSQTTRIMFVNFGKNEENYCLPLAAQLRQNGISCEIYPDAQKLKKQFDYANKKNIQFVVIAGEDEIKADEITVKNMITGEQTKISKEGIVSFICKNI